MKGIIYYTDNRLKEPIFSTVQNCIKASGLPIVSCSLKPIPFGKNIVLDLAPGPATMTKQILAALKKNRQGLQETDLLVDTMSVEQDGTVVNEYPYCGIAQLSADETARTSIGGIDLDPNSGNVSGTPDLGPGRNVTPGNTGSGAAAQSLDLYSPPFRIRE